MATALPNDHRALVITSLSSPPQVQQRPTPHPGPGTLVVKVLLTNILPYAKDVYSSSAARAYPFPFPMVPGFSAIATIAATGPDTTTFQPGDLVLVDTFIAARDDPAARFIAGLHSGTTAGGRKLMDGEFRDSTYAEYARIRLENCVKIPASVAQETNGESLRNLMALPKMLVPYGGFLDINLQPGERVIIAPATGYFGGCAVELALAMGASVIAAGRNGAALAALEERMQSTRLRTVQLTGDIATDAANLGPAEAFQDWAPPAAKESTHIKACLAALTVNGRASLMGGIKDDVPIPYGIVMRNNIKICGKWMYEAQDKNKLVRLLESGLLKLKPIRSASFMLEEWESAFQHAADNPGADSETLFAP